MSYRGREVVDRVLRPLCCGAVERTDDRAVPQWRGAEHSVPGAGARAWSHDTQPLDLLAYRRERP